jgi:ABC-type multidrug transport system ATPase subunit
VIDCKLVSARLDRVDLLPTTLAFDAGRHALLGRKDDGVSVLLACLGGSLRARGSLVVLFGAANAPKTRARVGYVPLDVALMDVLRVEEALAVARSIRKNAPASASSILAPLGIESLAKRRVDSLDRGETRAVALAEALASPTVSVLLVEEPFVAMAAPACAAMTTALAAKKNLCTVIATASARDATLLADDYALFDRGRLVRIVTEPPLASGRETPCMRVVASDVRALAAELARKPEVERLELSHAGGAHSVVVIGKDARALAAAVNDAIADSHADVQRIDTERATLEDLTEAARANSPAGPP